MVSINLHAFFKGLLDLALLAGGALYSGLVLISYLEGRGYARPRFDRRDPARSFRRVAVWLGVKAVVLAVRAATPVFEMLSEASAEVGDWFLNQRHHETH